MNKIKVGIIGASGYTASELIKILLKHPFVEISLLTSRSVAGIEGYKVFPEIPNLKIKILKYRRYFKHTRENRIRSCFL